MMAKSNEIPRWLMIAGAVFGALASFYVLAAAINLDVPRWTWYSEHLELAGVSLSYIKLQKERRKWELEKIWPKLTDPSAPGKYPPYGVQKEYNLIVDEIKEYKRMLKRK